MKSIYIKLLAMTAFAVIAFGSCNKAEIESQETVGNSVVVKAYVPDDMTKTTFAKEEDHYAVKWDSNDKVALLYNGILYESTSIKRSSDNKCAEFTFDGIESLEGEYQLFYPYSAAKYENGVVTMTFGNYQRTKKDSPYAAATIMVAEGSGTDPVTFRHLISYAKMTIVGLTAGEKLKRVELYRWKAITGDIVYDPSTYSLDYKTDVITNETNHPWIEFDNDEAKTVKDDGTIDVWIALKPMTFGAKADFFDVTIVDSNDAKTVVKMKVAKEVKFEVGKVTSFPMYSATCKITFNTHGGSAVSDQYIQKGSKLRPVKTSIYSQGLYEGDIADVEDGFDGWYLNDSYSGDPIDFNTYVPESDVTLHAKWSKSVPTSLGKTIDDAFNYVNGASGTASNYTYILTEDQSFGNKWLNLNKATASLRFIGAFSEKKITKTETTSNKQIFKTQNGTLILGKNVTLTGEVFGKSSTVVVDGGQFVMEEGSKISGTIHDGTGTGEGDCRGVVHITTNESSMFTMNGGEICNCDVTVASTQGYFSGIVSINWGKFVMNGGKIHDNKISAAHTVVLGGGVAMSPARQFTKTGGEIYDNTAVNTAETDSKFIGQQAVIGSKSNLSWVYKIDDNIDSSLNLNVSNIGETNPAPEPWIRIPRN